MIGVILTLYGVGVIFHGVVTLVLFSLESSMNDPKTDDRERYARWLLATPVWPILYVTGFFRVIAKARIALAEGQKKEEK